MRVRDSQPRVTAPLSCPGKCEREVCIKVYYGLTTLSMVIDDENEKESEALAPRFYVVDVDLVNALRHRQGTLCYRRLLTGS